jgi:Na+-translocating ferredoxin:NAD+ oxidoreductase RnfD subunit
MQFHCEYVRNALLWDVLTGCLPLKAFAIYFLVEILFSIVICMLTAFITAKLRQSRASMTPNTYKLQQQLVISLSLEVHLL